MRLALLILALFGLSGCVAMQRMGANYPAGSAPVYNPAPVSVPAAAPVKLMLFGGIGHKTYLGCLNCSQYESDSVLNKYGDYGSRYGDASIFNPYGDFGSAYGEYSACNRYAADPPVIVDKDGHFYGRLTINTFAERTNSERTNAWIAGVCAGR